MDWPVAGALAGVTILAGVVGYGTLTLLGSGAQTAPTPPSPVLLPARAVPAVANVSPVPDRPGARADTALWNDPASASGATALSEASPNQDGARLTARRPAAQPPAFEAAGSRPPPASPDPAKKKHVASQEPDRPGGRVVANPTIEIGGSRLPPEGQKKASPAAAPLGGEAARAERASFDEWKVITTPKASYSNLGGHVDANGYIDTLASSYFRDAIKKHPNYPKLPPSIKTAIEAPRISLTKLAPYRTLLGINDRKIEEEQGVKFVRLASTRDVDPGELEAADAPPLELGPIPAQ